MASWDRLRWSLWDCDEHELDDEHELAGLDGRSVHGAYRSDARRRPSRPPTAAYTHRFALLTVERRRGALPRHSRRRASPRSNVRRWPAGACSSLPPTAIPGSYCVPGRWSGPVKRTSFTIRLSASFRAPARRALSSGACCRTARRRRSSFALAHRTPLIPRNASHACSSFVLNRPGRA
jgi:hypothetical protein